MHSCTNAVTSYFARVPSMQDIILLPSALLKDKQACTFRYLMQKLWGGRWSVASKGGISQDLGADVALYPTPFFLMTIVAQLNGRVTAGAFMSFGDLTLCWQLAQVALTSAVGLNYHMGSWSQAFAFWGLTPAAAQPQLGIWVTVSCSGCRPGVCL